MDAVSYAAVVDNGSGASYVCASPRVQFPQTIAAREMAVSPNGRFMVCTESHTRAALFAVEYGYTVTFRSLCEVFVAGELFHCHVNNVGTFGFTVLGDDSQLYFVDGTKVPGISGYLLGFSDGGLLAVHSNHVLNIFRWDLDQRTYVILRKLAVENGVWKLAFVDENSIVWTDVIGVVYRWTFENLSHVWFYKSRTAELAISLDKRWAAFVANPYELSVRVCDCSEEPIVLKGLFVKATFVGNKLLAVRDDGILQLWDLDKRTHDDVKSEPGAQLFVVFLNDPWQRLVDASLLVCLQQRGRLAEQLPLFSSVLKLLPFELCVNVCMAVCGVTLTPLPCHFEKAMQLLG